MKKISSNNSIRPVSLIKQYAEPLAAVIGLSLDTPEIKAALVDIETALNTQAEKKTIIHYFSQKISEHTWPSEFVALILICTGAIMRDVEIFTTGQRVESVGG